MNGESLNIQQDNLEKLKQHFPELFSEGQIDIEKFNAAFTGNINFANERYVLNWAGKADAFKTLQVPTTATLKPCPGEGINDGFSSLSPGEGRGEATQNVFIEGENLEVLKVLQKSYYNKIKCIIIDPPYNTGNDSFIYPDSFKESRADYEKRVGDKDEEGFLMKEGFFKKNSKDSGHFHSNWLSMMYPRLFLAKNLLKDDGVIFIHIDDNEVHNLRLLMNEIFGEENFIESIAWNKRIPKNDKGIGSIHEYILVFVKNASINHEFLMAKEGLEEINSLLIKLKKQRLSVSDGEKEIRKLYIKKGYDRGITLYNSLNSDYRLWGKINMSWPNANTFGPRYEVLHPKTGKPVKIPDRGWRWKKETFAEAANIVNGKFQNIIGLYDGSFICGNIWFDKDEKIQPSSISYLDELDNLLLRSIISLKSNGGIEVEKLFDGKSYFSYPKPSLLIKLLLKSIRTSPNDIILDFFAGSGTTAQAVLELNKEDNGNRKFILVQLPEVTDENTEAYKAGYKTIAAISKERIRRVIKKMQAEITAEEKKKSGQLNLGYKNSIAPNVDLGFKAFKLSPSNFKIWRGNEITEENLTQQLDAFTNPVKESSQEQNMLYELMVKAGYELTDKVEAISFPVGEGRDGAFYSVNNGELVIALTEMSQTVINNIIAAKPKKVITLDHLFAGNDQLKTNTVLQMKDAGVEFKTI